MHDCNPSPASVFSFFLLLLLLGDIFVLPVLFTKRFIMKVQAHTKAEGAEPCVPVTQLQSSTHRLPCFIYSCPLSSHFHAPRLLLFLKILFIYLFLLSLVFIAARGSSPVVQQWGPLAVVYRPLLAAASLVDDRL